MSRRHLRSNNTWLHNVPALMKGKDRCTLLMHPDDAARCGIADDDVKLIIMRNLAADEDHAVVAVRFDGHWIILDNRWLNLVEDSEMPEAVPVFGLDQSGVKQFAPELTPHIAAAPASVPTP